MTERLRSVPLGAIHTHTTLQNRNTTASMRRQRREAEQRVDHIARLQQSIAANGLERPLEVVAMSDHEAAHTGKRFWLVGGHHRLEATKLLGHQEVAITLLDGQGLQAARQHSYLQNAELFRQLEDDQRIDNAWRAINDPGLSTFRDMTNKELADTFNVNPRTVDRLRELRRRWAAREQDIDYEAERSKAKEDGQRGIRAFNQALDDYCSQNAMGLFSHDYGSLKRELGRGTTEAVMEERQLIARTVPTIVQGLNSFGLEKIESMRAALRAADAILAKAKTYYEACELADVRFLDSSSSNLERYIRSQEVEPMLHNVLAPIDEEPDF